MEKQIDTIKKLKYKKCEYEWYPRATQKPKVCPKCCNDWRTPYKNKSRQVRK